jgi:maltose/moltooligosaccharide transporter
MAQKPRKTYWQIWNMSFGFLGIQFGWGLQMANMSAIYEYLGATADKIPILWLAAPLTGLIVQPIIGHASDNTWTRLGRRRPYFLVGAILSSIALIMMPRSSVLWMAAGLLWILDSSINISMEPFRAFGDSRLSKQRHQLRHAKPIHRLAVAWLSVAADLSHLRADTSGRAISPTVRLSFHVGAAAFSAVPWTIRRPEYPPDDLNAFRKKVGASKRQSRAKVFT